MIFKTNTIKQIKGNAVDYVLAKDDRVLLHVCNNKGVMGSGIAKEIRERIPEAFHVYRNSSLELGTVSSCGKVINMVAQDGYGEGIRHLNYGALARCLLIASIRKSRVEFVVPYKMGADRAGGDWEIVKELLNFFILDKYNLTIVELA